MKINLDMDVKIDMDNDMIMGMDKDTFTDRKLMDNRNF
jgi:hypothetical protein